MAVKFGSVSPDTLLGSSLTDEFFTGLGGDIILTNKGNDWVFSGGGDDQVTVGTGRVIVWGGSGADTVKLQSGSWALSAQSYSFGALAINLETQQLVGLTDVEYVNIGSTKYHFRSGNGYGNSISGTDGVDFIKGLDGNDTIAAGGGDDHVSGGLGSDQINAGAGNDVVDESRAAIGANNVYFSTGHRTDTYDLGTGDDQIILSPDIYYAYYSNSEHFNANDLNIISGGAGADVVYLEDNDYFSKWSVRAKGEIWYTSPTSSLTTEVAQFNSIEQIVDTYNDRVWTSSTNSYARSKVKLTGTALSEIVQGNSSSNTLNGKGGFDYFTGGAGSDTVVLSGVANLYDQHNSTYNGGTLIETKSGISGVRLDSSFDTSDAFIGRDIEMLSFTGGPGTGDDHTYGFKVISNNSFGTASSDASDFIVVQTSSDQHSKSLSAAGGEDHIFGWGNIGSVNGGNGNDFIHWTSSGSATTYIGGAGDDTIVAEATTIFAPAVISGGTGNDDIQAIMVSASVDAGDGDDVVRFYNSSKISGGAGNDLFMAPALIGKTTIDGGAGSDVLSLGISADYKLVKTATGYDLEYKYGFDGNAVSIKSVEAVHFADYDLDVANRNAFGVFNGGSAADKKFGGEAADFMSGGSGSDNLFGESGDDTLAGDDGNDTLNGAQGDDVINGGGGNDVLTGGAGFDTFVFQTIDGSSGVDRIKDFRGGGIGLGDMIAIRVVTNAFDSFEEIKAHLSQSGDNAVIDLSSYASAGDAIVLEGIKASTLVSEDFVFLYA